MIFQLIPAPVLWSLLLLITILGPSWLTDEPPLPLARRYRRNYAQYVSRERKRYFHGLTVASCKLHVRRTKRHHRRHRNQACKAFVRSGLAQGFQEERGVINHHCNPWQPSSHSSKRRSYSSKRRSHFHRKFRRSTFKNQRRRPRQLNLSDPIFRQGIGYQLQTYLSKSHFAPTSTIKSFLSAKTILQHPMACQAAMPPGDSYTIVWDSGASMCVTFDKNDFVGPIKPLPKGSSIQGITNNLKIEGVGTVIWSLLDTNGTLCHLKLPCYYIPKIKQRLLSTSVFTKTYPKSLISVSNNSWSVTQESKSIDIYINPRNNLPMSKCYRHQGLQTAAANLGESIIHSNNLNLTEPQKELLRWHYRLGHIGFRTIQFIMRTGALASSEGMRRLHNAASKIQPSDLPKCSACQFGRQTNRSVPGSKSSAIKDRSGILSADKTHPGQLVFIDHFVSTTRGRKFKGYGVKEPNSKSPRGGTSESFRGGCIFVDAGSGFVHVEFQSHLNSFETIQAVESFESLARDNGIIISQYQSDNGSAFTSKAFKDHLLAQGQTAKLSAAGSHHQMGKAERGIRTIMAMARTMLLHAAIHWPDMADPSLWPMAVKHAVWIYNHIPHISNGLSPVDQWSKTKFPLRKLHNLHVWGSPLYVLQKRLADGKSIGRWQPRSQRCVNVGFSDSHSKDAPLVLNPATGSITTQWNVNFDDWFSTVGSTESELPDFNAVEWSRLFGTTTTHFPEEPCHSEEPTPFLNYPTLSETIADSKPPVPLTPDPFHSHPSFKEENSGGHTVKRKDAMATHSPAPHVTAPTSPASSSAPVSSPRVTFSPSTQIIPSSTLKASPLLSAPSSAPSVTPAPLSVPPSSASPSKPTFAKAASPKLTTALKKIADHNSIGSLNPLPQRPKRQAKSPEVLNYDSLGGNLAQAETELRLCGQPGESEFSLYVAENNDPLFLNWTGDGWIFLANKKAKDPDLLTWDQAMRDFPNLDRWLAAVAKEIKQLEDKECWVECLKSEAEAKGKRIIPCQWVLRVKRSPSGEIIKYKGRIVLRGDLMDEDEDNFAPVCAWSSVRFFLVISIILGWVTVSVDWANAFIQAELKEPMYMAIPRGFKSKFGFNGCLRVTKSLYGSRLAPRNWYNHLRSALINDLGFKESQIDPCLLYKKNILLVLYVDDAGISAPSKDVINDFVSQLKDLGFDLDIEDDFNSYLGIGIEEFANGSRHMTQKGLIKKLLQATDMTDCNPNWCPTTQVALGSDPEGEPYDQKQFNYASVVGMLLYLSNNTRPDITFAVSQVARFTHNPKKSHASAVKSILRYLSRTSDKGLIVKPDGTFNLRCHVDADFSGLHGREPESNPASAKSRYGYIITFAGVPLIWKSQLISEICLSTLHAEYVGLSFAIRALIPLRTLVSDVVLFHELPPMSNPEVHCEVFEDNQSAFLLATNQRLTQRTKYFNVKYHFFWSYVYDEEKNPNGWVKVVKCPTNLMDADYLTKGLPRPVFDANRLRVQGW